MSESAYDRVTWRGVKLNKRTRDALLWAERKSGVRIEPAQGSWSGASASGGTHLGGGAVDIRTRQLTRADRIALVRALKDAGFAAWYRPETPGVWGEHIHALAIGDQELAPGARAQVASFDQARDGLRGNRPDPTYRPEPRKRFSWAKGRPVTR